MGQHSQKTNDTNRKLIIYRILCIILAVVLVTVLFLWARSTLIQRNAQNLYDELAEQVNQANDNHTSGESGLSPDTEDSEEDTQKTDVTDDGNVSIPVKNIDWEELRQVNKDVYAWIYIPNTNIDYPILQHPFNDNYYLNYNLDGSKGRPGCIFTQSMNSKNFTDCNTVIYGHNMQNGEMFRTLHNYEDEGFFDDNPYIYIYTENGTLVYEVFAAYTSDDSHILQTNDFSTKEGYGQYLDKVFSVQDDGAHFRDDVEVGTDNPIVTLSTCVGTLSHSRYLVQAVLINDIYEMQENE